MEVNGPGSVPGAFPIQQSRQISDNRTSESSQPVSPRDEVEISSTGKMLDKLNQSSELRSERLAQIKAEIEAGTYETPEKLEAALGRLLNELETDE